MIQNQNQKIITILGTRPEITKLSPLLPLLDQHFTHKVIHTNQHYDYNMDKVFFEQLKLRQPDFNLNIGKANLSHAQQTAQMMIKIEEILLNEKPDWVLVFADPNTPLAGAIVASKLNIKLIHMEAGCRSFNKQMPEEINRIICDHAADLLLAPDEVAKTNLLRENINEKTIHIVGSTAIPAARRNVEFATNATTILSDLNLQRQQYILLTIHRAENTNNTIRLKSMIDAINEIAEHTKIIFPIHPRTKKIIVTENITLSDKIKIIDPQDYLSFLSLLSNANFVMSDSGGIQEEAAALNIPCLILRNETEWTYLTDMGKNLILTTNKEKIINQTLDLIQNPKKLQSMRDIPLNKNMEVAQKIIEVLNMKNDQPHQDNNQQTQDSTTQFSATNNQETLEPLSLTGKTIIVTGGAGFVGSHLVDRILKDNPKKLIVLSNFFLGNPENLESAAKHPAYELRRCDVTDYEPLENVFNKNEVDVVFNLAVIPLPTSLTMPEWSIRQNIEMTLNICKLLRLKKFKTLIQYSSSEACGTAREIPMVEEYQLDPETPYAASKAATDHIALSYHHTFGCDVAVIRPYNQYGPRQNAKKYAGIIPLMISRMRKNLPVHIFGDGEQTRDFLHVFDTVNATIEVYKNPKTRGQIINVASGKEVKIKDLVYAIADQLGYSKSMIGQKPARIGDVRRHVACTKKAKKLLGWEQTIQWEQGLQSTVQWYLDHPEVFD